MILNAGRHAMQSTRWMRYGLIVGLVSAAGVWTTAGQNPAQNPPQDPAAPGETVVRAPAADPNITDVVARLDLEKYKATVKGLTQFGDRRQGTKRNRDAVDWIEAQLKSYGCTNTERIKYMYQPPPAPDSATLAARRAAAARNPQAPAQGGGRIRGNRARTGVNTDSVKQTDARIRAIDAEPTTPGERQEVYCTKVGTTHPEEMYIVGGHMDGHGWGEAANDDGSG